MTSYFIKAHGRTAKIMDFPYSVGKETKTSLLVQTPISLRTAFVSETSLFQQ